MTLILDLLYLGLGVFAAAVLVHIVVSPFTTPKPKRYRGKGRARY